MTEDHVHIFSEAPPKYSPARIVQMLKSISSREVWSDGYFVRSVVNKVMADIIR